MKRILYSADSKAKDIIKKHCDSLWFGEDSRGRRHSLEDICFFLNGKLFFGTVSHEHICRVFPPDKAFETRMFEIYGNWQTEQIRLSDYLPEGSNPARRV